MLYLLMFISALLLGSLCAVIHSLSIAADRRKQKNALRERMLCAVECNLREIDRGQRMEQSAAIKAKLRIISATSRNKESPFAEKDIFLPTLRQKRHHQERQENSAKIATARLKYLVHEVMDSVSHNQQRLLIRNVHERGGFNDDTPVNIRPRN